MVRLTMFHMKGICLKPDSINKSVTLPTGQNINIEGIGQIRLNEYMLLANVLYIPDFRLNLLSISQLTKDLGCRVMFDEGTCLIHDPIRGLMIGQGEEIANLYVLDGSTIFANASMRIKPSINVIVETTLWHNRLGHPSVEKIDMITDVLGIKQRNKRIFSLFSLSLSQTKALSVCI